MSIKCLFCDTSGILLVYTVYIVCLCLIIIIKKKDLL